MLLILSNNKTTQRPKDKKVEMPNLSGMLSIYSLKSHSTILMVPIFMEQTLGTFRNWEVW